ncbi:MAG TPA: hypothetical protein VF221_05595 [Chloroflexota bacterium]
MADLIIILWLPATIALMAVAFVVTLSAAGAATASEPATLTPVSSRRQEDHGK